jgi:multidrug efflux pump subunit AcrB
VARVEFSAQDHNTDAYLGGRQAVAFMVYQQPEANALATAALLTVDDGDLVVEKSVDQRVATRYDQLASNYLAFVQLAPIR